MSENLSSTDKPLNNDAVNNSSRKELLRTEDGSFTFWIPEVDETYHSRHGAEQESRHVFIEHGLNALQELDEIHVLEVGLGTGLNAMLTHQAAGTRKINYTALEPFPLNTVEVNALLEAQQDPEKREWMQWLHELPFDTTENWKTNFVLEKKRLGIADLESCMRYDVIYFDAFGPRVAPALWEASVLQKCYDCLKPGGIWVSYCAKGEVRRNLQQAGFVTERLAGPPGKREMLRARKN
jgi:tRNA U34 5-methylaminomethyl-2-thiouridine-forming methyltransferase MnmC